MGDRCSLEIDLRKEHLPFFAKEFGVDENYIENEENGIIKIVINEVNYGGQDELMQIAKKKIPFTGSHDSGGSYGPAEFVAVDGIYSEIEVSNGHPFLAVDENGRILHKEDRNKIKNHYKLEKRARSAIEAV